MPHETKNIRPEQRRRMISLDELTRPPTEEEAAEWESEEIASSTVPDVWPEETGAAIVRRARRCVWRGKLNKAEVLALRLWTGPMYLVYNSVLRGVETGGFTTTLHAVHSGILKLSQKSPPERVYRGVANRAIKGEDFKTGSFVEMGVPRPLAADVVSPDPFTLVPTLPIQLVQIVDPHSVS